MYDIMHAWTFVDTLTYRSPLNWSALIGEVCYHRAWHDGYVDEEGQSARQGYNSNGDNRSFLSLSPSGKKVYLYSEVEL